MQRTADAEWRRDSKLLQSVSQVDGNYCSTSHVNCRPWRLIHSGTLSWHFKRRHYCAIVSRNHFQTNNAMREEGTSICESVDPFQPVLFAQADKGRRFSLLLTLSQTANFRLFQMKRVCRRQF